MEKGKPKSRLVFVEDLSEQVRSLAAVNEKLTSERDEARNVLRELVEACEAGGTSLYMEALGRACRLLDELDNADDVTADAENVS